MIIEQVVVNKFLAVVQLLQFIDFHIGLSKMMWWLHLFVENLQKTLSHYTISCLEIILSTVEEGDYLAKFRKSAIFDMFPAYIKRKLYEFLSLDSHMSHPKSNLFQTFIDTHNSLKVDAGLEEIDYIMEKFLPFFLFFPLFLDDLHILYTNRLL